MTSASWTRRPWTRRSGRRRTWRSAASRSSRRTSTCSRRRSWWPAREPGGARRRGRCLRQQRPHLRRRVTPGYDDLLAGRLADPAPGQAVPRRGEGRVTGPEGYLAGLEGSARERLSDAVYGYFRQGAGDEVSAPEAAKAWQRLRFLPARPARRLVRHDRRRPFSVRRSARPSPSRRPRCNAMPTPSGRAEMARGIAVGGQPALRVQQRWRPVRGDRPSWWTRPVVVGAGVRPRGPSASPRHARAGSSAGCAAVVLTVDTPVVAAKPESGGSVWDVTPADFLHANEELRWCQSPGRGEGTGPGACRHRLADAGHRAAGRRQGRTARGRRAASAWRPAPRPSGSPTTADGSWTGASQRPRRCLRWQMPSATPPRSTWTAACEPGATCSPRWRSGRERFRGPAGAMGADDRRRGRRRRPCCADSRAELEEAMTLSGCPAVDGRRGPDRPPTMANCL